MNASKYENETAAKGMAEGTKCPHLEQGLGRPELVAHESSSVKTMILKVVESYHFCQESVNIHLKIPNYRR